MELDEYLKEIRDFAVLHKKATDLYVHDIGYFEGHLPRFIATIEIFKEHLDKEKIKIVHDLGTDVPYASLYFKRTQGAEVNCGCVDNQGDIELEPGVHRFHYNLNTPFKLKQADLVICTECLEHLPSNLYRVRQVLCEAVLDQGFLFLSFPLIGTNAKDYHLDYPKDWRDWNGSHEHIREFTVQTAHDFCTVSGFRVIAEKITWTDAYGGKIMNVLLKKELYA